MLSDLQKAEARARGFEAVARLVKLESARRRVQAARARCEGAAHEIDLATIYERMAEIESQHDPLNDLAISPRTARAKMIAAATYVVYGRLPKEERDAE